MLNKIKTFSFFGLFCLFLAFAWAKLPPRITPCHRNNPHLDSCIIKAVYALRPFMASGNFGGEYRTPPLEPLHLDNIEMGRGSQFYAVFSDIQARGGSNFIIDKLKADVTTLSFDITLTLPKIEFWGKYLMKLNLLLLQGKGDMRGLAENTKAVVNMRGARYLKNGVEYVKMTNLTMRLSIGKFKLHLDNLFNGDKLLGELGSAFINDNQQLYLKEIVPGLERALSQKFLSMANEILSTATFDEMFPANLV